MTTREGMEGFANTRICLTVTLHPQMPPWLDPASPLLWNTQKQITWWQHYVRKVGHKEALRKQAIWLAGGTDVRGNWWCGNCLLHVRFINWGERLGYPDLYDIYPLPETRQTSGYANWLHMARFRGLIAATVVDILEGRIIVRKMTNV